MTNSKRGGRNTSTGTPETTTPATEAKFVSNRGTVFVIDSANNGLFFIRMRAGGVAPAFCHEFFTSKRQAEQVLELYLRRNDRLGFAEYPSKDK